jgi:hypothetical protein
VKSPNRTSIQILNERIHADALIELVLILRAEDWYRRYLRP